MVTVVGSLGLEEEFELRRVNIKAILADPALRRKMIVSAIRAIQAREGIDTTEEQATRAYNTVQRSSK